MSTRVYVGRLPNSARERDVERFFKGYGRLRDILLKNGYGFVEFDDPRDADDAVYDLHGKTLHGDRLIVEHAKQPGSGRRRDSRDSYSSRSRRPPPSWIDSQRQPSRYGVPQRTPHRLIVENLSSRVSWQDLKDYMRQAGEVTYADAHKEEKNVGIVEFASRSDMKKAVEKLDGLEINGRKIHLVEDKTSSRKRSASYSTSRSRSRSYSRSRSAKRSRKRSNSRRSHSRQRSDSRKRSVSSHRSGGERREGSRRRSASRSPSNKGSPAERKSGSRKSGHRSGGSSVKRSVSHSRSRSRSKHSDRSLSRSRSRSRSVSKSPSKSRSASPERNKQENGRDGSESPSHED